MATITKKAARRKTRKHAKKLVKRIRQADFAVSPNGRPMDTTPLAKPGYHGKRKLSDYERGIAHALMRKGYSESRAIAMARGLLKKANRSGRWGDHGRAHAATRAGAAASIAQRKTFANDLDRQELVDLAVAAVHHYRHGWIRIDGLKPDAGRKKTRVPAGRAKARAASLQRAAMREQARRQLASVRLRGSGSAPRQTMRTSPKTWNGESKFRPAIHSIYSNFSNVLLDQCLAEAARRDLDLGWDPKLHPRIPFGKGGGRFTRKLGAPKPEDVTDEKYRAHVAKVDSYLVKHSETAASHVKYASGVHADGSIDWTPERRALHQKLVKAEFDRQVAAGAKKEKKAIFLGGLPGAGKSSGLKKTLGDVENDYITVNPDIFKERMAHMGLIDHHEGLTPLEASGFHHEETATMVEMLAQHAMDRGYNLIHDITMNSEKSVSKRHDPLKERGYQTTAMFFDIPHDFSQKSVEDRHRRGWELSVANPGHVGQRLVPSSHVASGKSKKGSSSANRDAFDATKHLFDGYKLFNQGGAGPDGRGQYLMQLIEHRNQHLLNSR